MVVMRKNILSNLMQVDTMKGGLVFIFLWEVGRMQRLLPVSFARYLAAVVLMHRPRSAASDEALLDILAALPGLDEVAWLETTCMLSAPLPENEDAVLLEHVRALLKEPDDRQYVCDALLSVLRVDGTESHEEDLLLTRTLSMLLEDASEKQPGHLAEVLWHAVEKRRGALALTPHAEMPVDVFLHRHVIGNVIERMSAHGVRFDPSDEAAMKLAFAAVVLGRMAGVEGVAEDEDLDAIATLIQSHWAVGWVSARFVAELASSRLAGELDLFRVVRGFCALADEPERHAMLEMLLLTAERMERLSHADIDELRKIAHMFHLSRLDTFLLRLEPHHGEV